MSRKSTWLVRTDSAHADTIHAADTFTLEFCKSYIDSKCCAPRYNKLCYLLVHHIRWQFTCYGLELEPDLRFVQLGKFFCFAAVFLVAHIVSHSLSSRQTILDKLIGPPVDSGLRCTSTFYTTLIRLNRLPVHLNATKTCWCMQTWCGVRDWEKLYVYAVPIFILIWASWVANRLEQVTANDKVIHLV